MDQNECRKIAEQIFEEKFKETLPDLYRFRERSKKFGELISDIKKLRVELIEFKSDCMKNQREPLVYVQELITKLYKLYGLYDR